MIQRIQTLYLLGVALLSVLLVFVPVAEFTTSEENIVFSYLDILSRSSLYSVEKFSIITFLFVTPINFLLAFVSIFLFKQRSLQLQLGNSNIILLCCLIVTLFWCVDSFEAQIAANDSELAMSYGIGAVLPLVSIILTLLANKAIRKDEALVRAADRLR